MAMDMNQIRQMNYEFYNSETYCLYAGSRNKVSVFLLIIFNAIVAVFINQLSLFRKLIEKAGYQETGGIEVMDWVWQETMKRLISMPTFFILSCAFSMGVFVSIMFYKVKSYDLHKYRQRIRYTPLIIFSFFYCLSVGVLIYQRNADWWLSIWQFVNVIPIVLGGRSLVPLEMKRGIDFSGVEKSLGSLANLLKIIEVFNTAYRKL